MTSQIYVEQTQTRVSTASQANRAENRFLTNFPKIDVMLRLRGRRIRTIRCQSRTELVGGFVTAGGAIPMGTILPYMNPSLPTSHHSMKRL